MTTCPPVRACQCKSVPVRVTITHSTLPIITYNGSVQEIARHASAADQDGVAAQKLASSNAALS